MFKNLFYGFMNKLRLVVTIIVALFIVAGVCGVLGMNGMSGILERIVMFVFTLICGMVMYLIVYYWYGNDYKCPSCKKRFCLKKTGEEVAKRENISVLVETNTRNRNGDVIGCTFTKNTARERGGAIYFAGRGNVSDCSNRCR